MSALSQKVAAAIVGVGAVSVLATGAANAHPGGPAPPVPQSTKVPETNCTLGQVEKALAKEDPAAWKKINSSPEKRARFENMVVLTKEQRQAKKEEWKATTRRRPACISHEGQQPVLPLAAGARR